jgi:hypothetical protein
MVSQGATRNLSRYGNMNSFDDNKLHTAALAHDKIKRIIKLD